MALTLHGTVSDNTVALDRKTATPLIINGDMRIAQRGDQTGITSSQYINVDRFFVNMINLGTWSFTQSTDTPTGLGFASSLKIDCTTADASPASADNFYLSMQSEGQNLQILEKGTSDAQTSTLSYWIKSNKTGNYVVELWDRTNDRHVGVVKTISSADTWQKVVCNIPADTSGALANTNARSIMISWAFDSGSNFTSGTLPSAWQARVDANRFVGTNLGLGDNTANEVLITGVQWEVGTFGDDNALPPFQFEDVGTSLARCQRYTQVFGGNNNKETFCSGSCNSATVQTMLIEHKTVMRTTPSVSVSALDDFEATLSSGFNTATTSISLATDNSGPTASTLTTNTSSQSASQLGRYCNLRCIDTTNGKLILSAEL